MAFRRSVFEKIGPFDAKFGSGTKIPAEDLDFFYRAYAEGFKLIYSPDVVVYHNHGRRTDDEVGALSKQYLIGKGGFYCKHALKGDLNVIKMVYWEILSFVRRMGQMSLGGAYYLGASLLSTFSRSSAKTPNAASRSLGEKKRFSDEAV
jgi:GT2 family glycosyltransferase